MYNVSLPKVANSPAFTGIKLEKMDEKDVIDSDKKIVEQLVQCFKKKYPESETELKIAEKASQSYYYAGQSRLLFNLNSSTQPAEDLFVKALTAAGFKTSDLTITPCKKGSIATRSSAGLEVLG